MLSEVQGVALLRMSPPSFALCQYSLKSPVSGIDSRHSRGYVTRTVLTAELYGRTYTTIPLSFSLRDSRDVKPFEASYSTVLYSTVHVATRILSYNANWCKPVVQIAAENWQKANKQYRTVRVFVQGAFPRYCSYTYRTASLTWCRVLREHCQSSVSQHRARV